MEKPRQHYNVTLAALTLAGITPDQRVITYCHGAVRAAHSALALKLAGYPNVQVYDGSWEEWGNRDDLPIETGPSEEAP